MGIQIDGELCALLQGGAAVVVGTRDAGLAPEIARGWGVQVLPEGATIELCVGLPSGARTLLNVADNGWLALTCVRPTDYRQVQLKGRALVVGEPTADDRRRVERHREAFQREVAQVGIPPGDCHRFWSHDEPSALVKLRFLPDEAFDQTPGPEAGRPL